MYISNIITAVPKIMLCFLHSSLALATCGVHTPWNRVYYVQGIRGVPRIWEGGGPINFFFRFGNLHVAKRHAAHGEAMRIARGVRGHAPPRKFFKTVQFGAF